MSQSFAGRFFSRFFLTRSNERLADIELEDLSAKRSYKEKLAELTERCANYQAVLEPYQKLLERYHHERYWNDGFFSSLEPAVRSPAWMGELRQAQVKVLHAKNALTQFQQEPEKFLQPDNTTASVKSL